MTLKEAIKFEIKCCKYLIRRLETLRNDIQKQVDKEAEETEEPVKTIRSAAVEELNRYISDLKRDVRDLEWDMLTPEEQEKIRKANKAFFMEKHRKAGDRT